MRLSGVESFWSLNPSNNIESPSILIVIKVEDPLDLISPGLIPQERRQVCSRVFR